MVYLSLTVQTRKLVALSKQHAVDVVVAVELERNDSAPLDLPLRGAAGAPWVQVSGSCKGAPGKARRGRSCHFVHSPDKTERGEAE
jgi:hypothetical protein